MAEFTRSKNLAEASQQTPLILGGLALSAGLITAPDASAVLMVTGSAIALVQHVIQPLEERLK